MRLFRGLSLQLGALLLLLVQASVADQLSKEALFDILVPSNTLPNEEEVFPPLSLAEHYSVSWSVAMSFSDFGSSATNSPLPEKTLSNSNSLVDQFLDHKSRFQFQLRLRCPTASRLVLGLVDEQGQRQRPRTKRNMDANDSNREDRDAVACGPPIDMSRNVLECRGIPSGDVQQQQFLFSVHLEVTCLAYVNGTAANLETLAYRNAAGERATQLGLTLSTPKQAQIKTKSNLVLTESFHAARITSLTTYLDPALEESEVASNSLDGSEFKCRPNAGGKNTCAEEEDAGDRDTMAPGLCTRQLTCYYSAPSKEGKETCTSNLQSLALSSEPKQKRRFLEDTDDDDDNDTTNNGSPTQNSNVNNKLRNLKNQRFHHQTRYRLLWSSMNFGCDSFSIMMDISCQNAATITYMGSSVPTVSNALSSTVRIHDESNGDEKTYWNGRGFDAELNVEEMALSSPLECYPSLFDETTVHCRRVVPNSAQQQHQQQQQIVALDIICTQTIDKEQDAVPNLITANILEATNVKCPSQSSASENESPNGQDSQQAGSLAIVGSAVTIVPVTMNAEDVIFSTTTNSELELNNNNNETNKYSNLDDDIHNNHVLFPPPQTGTTYDPTTSVQCSSCHNNYDFFVNYHNSIGNKVSQIVKGCQTMTACPAAGGCVNAVSPTTVSFLDPDTSQFLSYLSPVSSQRKESQWQLALLVSLLSTLALWSET